VHFLGIHWSNKEKTPFLASVNTPGKEKIDYSPLITGNMLTISIQQEKYCIGHSELTSGKRFLCKHTIKEALQRSSQCSSCKAKDSTYFMHLNGLSYDQINILRSKPSINYVNIFGNKIVKTGVTAKSRKFTRVLEQGALATMFFTDTDGYTSRIIENLVSKTFKIRQTVTWDMKIQYLQSTLTNDDAHRKLITICNQINEIFNDKNYPVALAKPEYHFNQDYYSLDLPKNINRIDFFEKFSFNDVISGEIIGIYGEIILLKQKSGSVFGVNTKALQGFLVQISKKESCTNVKNKSKLIKFYKQPLENLTLF